MKRGRFLSITLMLAIVMAGVTGVNAESWTTYNNSNTGGAIGNNTINNVAVDSGGNKWVGTNGGGLAKYDGTTWTKYTTGNSGLAGNTVKHVAFDSSGNKWVATGTGFNKYTGTSWTKYTTGNSGLASNNCLSVATEGTVIWVGTYDKGVSKYDGTTWTTYNTTNSGLPGVRVTDIAIESGGIKWFTTLDGVGKYDGTTWTKYASQLPSDDVYAAAVAPNGDKWFGTLSGVGRFTGTSWTTYTTSQGLPKNDTRAIIVAPDGIVWAGSNGSGASKFTGSTPWIVYNTSNSGLANNTVNATAVETSTIIWFGTDSGVSKYDFTPPPPVAAFAGSPTSGTKPLTVNFTDQSTNNPTSWSWTFGDSGTSTAQNPSHIYNNAGTYTVSLTVSNAYGSDVETKTNYITVTDAPSASLSPTSLTFNLMVGDSQDKTSVLSNNGGSELSFSNTIDITSAPIEQGIGMEEGFGKSILGGKSAKAARKATITDVKVNKNRMVLEYKFKEPSFSKETGGDKPEMEGLELYQRAGAPIIPVRPVTVLIPYGKKVKDVRVTVLDKKELAGTYQLLPAQRPYPLNHKGPVAKTPPNAAIYGQSTPWPGKDFQQVTTQYKRGYQLFTLNLFPLQYAPATGKLTHSSRMRVEIDLEDSANADVKLRPSKETKSRLKNMVDNPDTLGSYPEDGMTMQTMGAGTMSLPSGGPYKYVIITNQTLSNAPGPYNFQALRDHKIAKGITATIVTIEWIHSNYDGEDYQEEIRNFLIEAYQQWGTEYVLLGGINSIVPSRKLYVIPWDDWTAEDYIDNIPADSIYYGCVDPAACDFNYDTDSKWGEPNDGVNGGDVDLTAEIAVGRAAVENATEVSNFVRKTLAYDDTPNSSQTRDYLSQITMLGEWLGFGCMVEYAWPCMEQIRLGRHYDLYSTYGFENCPLGYLEDFDTSVNLYDGAGWWLRSDLVNRINSGVHVLNHLGHANETFVMKLDITSLSLLTNTDYFFAYSQGCDPGRFDDFDDCFAEEITAMANGAFAVIMNARYGWGMSCSTDGPNQRFNRQYWDAVLGEGMLEMGRANADSKEDNLWDINGDCIRYCCYELNLFGDPQQDFKFRRPWINVSPMSGTVAAHGSSDIVVTADTYGHKSGTYHAVVKVDTSDPADPNLTIDVTVNVSAAKRLSALPTSLDFGQVKKLDHKSLNVELKNIGDLATTVNSINMGNGQFTHDATLPLTIQPWSSVNINVIFVPTTLGTINSTMTINSNANDNPAFNVSLTGEGIPTPADAAFSASPTLGSPPLTVNFTDSSTGDVSNWNWNFGDSGTSTQRNPTHIYQSAGFYTVTLTVSGAGGTDAETKTDYIAASNAVANLSPTSLTFNISTDTISDQNVVLSNPGTSELRFNTTSITYDQGGGGGLGLGAVNYALQKRGVSPASPKVISEGEMFKADTYRKGVLLVRVKVDALKNNAALASTFSNVGMHQKKVLTRILSLKGLNPSRHWLVLEGDANMNLKAARRELLRNPAIDYVEPDYIVMPDQGIGPTSGGSQAQTLSTTPNDPNFADQWSLTRIQAPQAWDLHTGNGQVVVGIINTGVWYTHPDLIDNIWANPGEIPGNGIDDDGNGYIDDVHGYDFINEDGDPFPDELVGYPGWYSTSGTHFAGLIAARGNNNIGISGVCWNAKMASLKISDYSDSGGAACDISYAIEALNYATAMGIPVVSNFFGIWYTYSQAYKDAIDEAGSHGYLFINGSFPGVNDLDQKNYLYPQCYDSANIIVVLMTGQDDNRWPYYSNWGKNTVDLGAPGTDIISTTIGWGYDVYGGTTYASAIVTGATALLKSWDPQASGLTIKDAIMSTVDSVPSLENECASGGRLNVYKALRKMGVGWLSVTPASGSVQPGGNVTLKVRVDSNKVFGGVYTGTINLWASDPANSAPVINVTANVDAIKKLSASPASINFGQVPITQNSTVNLTLTNNGTAATTVSSININNTVFTHDASLPLTIPAYDSVVVKVTFAPVEYGVKTGTMTINSDAADNPTINVSLTGEGVPMPVNAVFSATPRSGLSPLTVSFTDLSTGDVNNWSWTFGDALTSTQQNPTHIYDSVGYRTVSLTVSGPGASDTETKTDYIRVYETGFTDNFNRADSTTLGNNWVEIQGDPKIASSEFKNGEDPVYNIAIQDGISGAMQEAAADFASVYNSSAPRFGVVLRYQNAQNYYLAYHLAGGTNQLRIAKVVGGTETVLASTSVSGPSLNTFFRICGIATGTTLKLELDGVEKLSVQDSSFSSGKMGIYLGQTSTTPHFHRADNFSAMAATPPGPPAAEFSGSPTDGFIPMTVNFADLSTGSVNTWSWTFGDGGTSTAQNPSHQYQSAGTYTVSLVVNGPYGSDTETKVNYITASNGTGFTDNFNRSDSTTLGNGWVEVQGDLKILSNEVRNEAIATNHIAIQDTLSGPKQTVSMDFARTTSSSASLGVMLRYQDAQNYYFIYRRTGSPSALRISKVVGGTETILSTVSISNPGVNTIFTIEGIADGTTLKLNLNGTEKLSVQDSTFSSGKVGFLIGLPNTSSHRADNFSATIEY